MSDLRFDDVVIESNSTIGPDGIAHQATCRSCSTQHKVHYDEFELMDLYILSEREDKRVEPANALRPSENEKNVLKYVAEIRAWNCCHEGQEPLDGWPDKPDVKGVDFGEK